MMMMTRKSLLVTPLQLYNSIACQLTEMVFRRIVCSTLNCNHFDDPEAEPACETFASSRYSGTFNNVMLRLRDESEETSLMIQKAYRALGGCKLSEEHFMDLRMRYEQLREQFISSEEPAFAKLVDPFLIEYFYGKLDVILFARFQDELRILSTVTHECGDCHKKFNELEAFRLESNGNMLTCNFCGCDVMADSKQQTMSRRKFDKSVKFEGI